MTDKATKLYEIMKLVDQTISNYEETRTGYHTVNRKDFTDLLLEYDIQINESPFMDDLSHLSSEQTDQLVSKLIDLYQSFGTYIK